ncbi:MAG: hypothetical protein WBD32_18750, partial [Acidobacteriaceae bacterium]
IEQQFPKTSIISHLNNFEGTKGTQKPSPGLLRNLAVSETVSENLVDSRVDCRRNLGELLLQLPSPAYDLC